MKTVAIASLLSVAALSGCTNLTSPARHKPLAPNQAYWFDYDASRRGTSPTAHREAETAKAHRG